MRTNHGKHLRQNEIKAWESQRDERELAQRLLEASATKLEAELRGNHRTLMEEHILLRQRLQLAALRAVRATVRRQEKEQVVRALLHWGINHRRFELELDEAQRHALQLEASSMEASRVFLRQEADAAKATLHADAKRLGLRQLIAVSLRFQQSTTLAYLKSWSAKLRAEEMAMLRTTLEAAHNDAQQKLTEELLQRWMLRLMTGPIRGQRPMQPPHLPGVSQLALGACVKSLSCLSSARAFLSPVCTQHSWLSSDGAPGSSRYGSQQQARALRVES